ncbi:hypothetical protein PZA11_006662 [Diplocarpon coronariae]
MAVAVLHAVARAAWKPVIALLGGWDWIARRFPAGEMVSGAGRITRLERDRCFVCLERTCEEMFASRRGFGDINS